MIMTQIPEPPREAAPQRDLMSAEPLPGAVTASLAFGVAGVVLSFTLIGYPLAFLLGAVGVVLGHTARAGLVGRARRAATTGVTLCWLVLTPGVLLATAFVVTLLSGRAGS